MCPPVTLPNEPPECATLRDNLDGNPQPLGTFEFTFFDNMVTFNEANNFCPSPNPASHLATVEELALIGTAFATSSGSCPTLVWATNNGIPTLAYIFQGSPPIIVPPPSLDCRAAPICVTPVPT